MGNLPSTLCYGSDAKYRIIPSHSGDALTKECVGQPGPTVSLRSYDDLHSVTVHIWGATITSWKVNNKEQLFLSSTAIYDTRKPQEGGKALRGGIPIVFPQFGEGVLRQHGFARTTNWTYNAEKSSVSHSSAIAVFQLTHNSETLAMWPHMFILTYTVTLTDNSLTTKLDIHNTQEIEFICQALLHTYLRVANIANTTVSGLSGRKYLDKLTTKAGEEDKEFVIIDQEVDRIMLVADAPAIDTDIVVFENSEPTIKVHKSAIIIANSTHVSTPVDVVFWNAWKAKCEKLVDMDNSAYLNYVCIEPGIVSNKGRAVPAHGTLSLMQVLTAIPHNGRYLDDGDDGGDESAHLNQNHRITRHVRRELLRQHVDVAAAAPAAAAAGGGGEQGEGRAYTHTLGTGHAGAYAFPAAK